MTHGLFDSNDSTVLTQLGALTTQVVSMTLTITEAEYLNTFPPVSQNLRSPG